MTISITTLGKFGGIPTKAASAKYGGGTSGGTMQIIQPKFPLVRVKKIEKQTVNMHINVINVIEKDL